MPLVCCFLEPADGFFLIFGHSTSQIAHSCNFILSFDKPLVCCLPVPVCCLLSINLGPLSGFQIDSCFVLGPDMTPDRCLIEAAQSHLIVIAVFRFQSLLPPGNNWILFLCICLLCIFLFLFSCIIQYQDQPRKQVSSLRIFLFFLFPQLIHTLEKLRDLLLSLSIVLNAFFFSFLHGRVWLGSSFLCLDLFLNGSLFLHSGMFCLLLPPLPVLFFELPELSLFFLTFTQNGCCDIIYFFL